MKARKRLSKEDERILKEAASHLEKNLKYGMTIVELAKKVGVGERNLQQKFKHQFGSSIHAFLITMRMQKARELLEGTEKPIKQIAEECGYKRITSFIKAFTKANKISPALWRKQTEELNDTV